jgi:hypothetical protein
MTLRDLALLAVGYVLAVVCAVCYGDELEPWCGMEASHEVD